MLSKHFSQAELAQADQDALRAMANLRRKALVAFGCATFTIRIPAPNTPTTTCLCCGKTSYHLADVEQRYCAFCHDYHTDWKQPLVLEVPRG